MADNKLTFGLEAEGLQRFEDMSRKVRETLKDMPRGGTEALRAFNAEFNSLLSMTEKMSGASGAIARLPNVWRESFSKISGTIIREVKTELGDLDRVLEKSMSKLELLQTQRRRAESMGATGSVARYDTAIQNLMPQLAGLFQGAGRAADMGLIGVAAGGAGGGGAGGGGFFGIGGGFGGFMGGFARGMGIPMGMLGAMGAAGTGMLAGQLAWSGTQYLSTGEAREQAAERSYRMLEAQEAMRGNITRRMLRQSGIGPEAAYLSGQLSPQFIAQNVELVVRQMFGFLQGKGPEQTRFEYIRTLSDRSVEANPQAQAWMDYQMRVRQGVDRPATMFGRLGTAAALGRMADAGIDLQRAAPIMNLMARFGAQAGGIDADLALGQERFGIGQSMIEQIARRGALRGRAGLTRGGMDETLGFLGQAGLIDPSTMPARDVLTNYVAQYMSQYGTLGGGNISDFGANVSNMQRAAQAAAPNAAPADIAGITAQTAGGYRQRLSSPGDPFRQMMMATLIGQGLNPIEAEYFMQRDITNRRTQLDMNRVLSGRQRKAVDVGGVLGGTFKAIEGLYTGAIDMNLGGDIRRIDPNAAARMVYRRPGEDVGPTAEAARNVFNTTDLPGAPRAQRGLETWEDAYRREQAKLESTMAGGMVSKDSEIFRSIDGSSKQMVQLMSELVKQLGGDPNKAMLPLTFSDVTISPITQPGQTKGPESVGDKMNRLLQPPKSSY